jgi:hypothetical protein
MEHNVERWIATVERGKQWRLLSRAKHGLIRYTRHLMLIIMR